MIQANELRIGNSVIDNSLSIPTEGKIEGIKLENGGYVFINGKWVKINLIEPEPITEEGLLKFGFKKTSGYFYHTDYKVNAYKSFQLVLLESVLSVTIQREIIIGELHYIHQLQNFYSALRGAEIKYV